MKLKLRLLLAGVAASTLAAACANGGQTGAGATASAGSAKPRLTAIADKSGCHPVFVFKPTGQGGSVSTSNSCTAPTPAQPPAEQVSATGEQAAKAAPPTISPQAAATRPAYASEGYPGPHEMMENADMAAFMMRVHSDFAAGKNFGAWGYVIIDDLAADQPQAAQAVLDAMAKHTPQPDTLSSEHMRPWVLAAAGQGDQAKATMMNLRRVLPGATLTGHSALLAEGLGDTDGALKIYAKAPQDFTQPDPSEAGDPGFLAKEMAYNSERLLALRHAELLRGLNRDEEAIAILSRLNASAKDDAYVKDRLAKAKTKLDRHAPRTLKQATALAISDEADLVEERQSIMGMMVGRGQEPPFNYLISSMRQSALLLDPDNGDVRLSETQNLYQHGHFEAALRLAQIGNPDKPHEAGLDSAAALAALELGVSDATTGLLERALQLDSSPQAKISAASAFTTAGKTDRAIQLLDQALKAKVDTEVRVAALMQKAQAKQQAGDVAAAVELARQARTLDDEDNTQQFLASMLIKSPQREEGLAMMREMMKAAPGNSGMMNNFGYSLIDGYASEAELAEGFRLLKQANRISPDEPNLLDSLGWAYYQYGDFRTAKRFLDMALEAYKPFHHWELFSHAGDIAWRLGDQDDARQMWKNALDARPPNDDAVKISAKLKSGLTTPAPQQRETPEVPLERRPDDQSDI